METGGSGGESGVCGGRRLTAGLAGVLAVLVVTGTSMASNAASTAGALQPASGAEAARSSAMETLSPATATRGSVTETLSSATATRSGAKETLSVAAAGPQASAALSSALTPAPARTLLSDPPRPLKDFTLTTEERKPLRLSELSGAPLLVFFGFAHCPSVCPTALTQLRLLEMNHARDLGATRIVVISVDGDRDTPAMLSEWLKPISPTFIGLTGPTNTVHGIAAQLSAAFFKGAQQPSGDYLVEHNSQVFLLDAQGRLRATFFDAPIEAMAQVTRVIAAESH
jgi:cytochrome oxidase Cu insertion factor (SCO1/SenC/PrrC family)